MEKLKVEALVSADVKVSNGDTAGRAYDISAVVRVDGGKAGSISSGEIRPAGQETDMPVATFDSWSGDSLNVQFNTGTDRLGILAEMDAFITRARTDREITVAAGTDI